MIIFSFGINIKELTIALANEAKQFTASECHLFFDGVEVFYFEASI